MVGKQQTGWASQAMKKEFEYRSYILSKEDGRYTARSLDGEECKLSSKFAIRVLRSIDILWEALDSNVAPSWFLDWLNSDSKNMDLDLIADALTDQSSSNEDTADNTEPISTMKIPTRPCEIIVSP